MCLAAIALRRPHLLVLDEPTNHLDLESVDALVDGLRIYGGGVLAVTHDASLVEALARDGDGVDMPLFVCRNNTVKVERGGFIKYKRDLAAAAAKREADATRKAAARAAVRAKARREKLAKAKAKAAGKPPKPP